jgi:hypothetical protein
LGEAINEVAKREGTPPDFTDFAWAMHKLNDPNYGPDDFTEGEKTALRKHFEKGREG